MNASSGYSDQYTGWALLLQANRSADLDDVAEEGASYWLRHRLPVFVTGTATQNRSTLNKFQDHQQFAALRVVCRHTLTISKLLTVILIPS